MYFLTFIFGMIIGSFLNVVIYRFNTGRGINGRSMCFSCNKKLSPLELIPFFSFLFQGGKCTKCKTKISWQYPAVELLTGLLFTLSFAKVSLINIPFVWVVMSILVVITVYDLRHKIIPDQFSYLFAILTFARIFISLDWTKFVLPTAEMLLAGPLLALPFYLIWMVSRGRWMGLGDAKLALGIGWFLAVYAPIFNPIVSDISVFMYSFWTGTIFFILVSLFGLIFKRNYYLSMKSEIPFAPFLIFGLLIVFLFRYNIVNEIFDVYFN